MSYAVICKNYEWHKQHDAPIQGHRIPVDGPPSGKIRVKCDSCGQTFTYEEQDVLQFAE